MAKAKALGLDWVAIKAWDGDGFGDENDATIFRDQFAEAHGPLKEAGLHVLAWGYLYGGPIKNWTSITPEREAAALMGSVQGAEGIILDAEYEYVNRLAEADRFFAALETELPLAFAPDFRIIVGNALASHWHAGGANLTSEPWPWGAFLKNCSAVLPQLYWTDFQVSPQVTFGLVDAYTTAGQANGWPALEILPILPLNATAGDLHAGRACVTERDLPGHSYWLLG